MRARKIVNLFAVRPVEKGEMVGIEIEMEGRGLDFPLPPPWVRDGDASLRGEAIEYKFERPQKPQNVMKALRDLRDSAKRHDTKWTPSRRCGVHVHINCQDLKEDAVLNFVCLYLTLEGLLTRWCGADREGNFFCLRSSDAEGLILQLAQCHRDGSLRGVINDNYRYAAVNLVALARYGSVEFRTMATKKNIMPVGKWVKMLLKVQEKSLTFNSPEEIVMRASKLGPKTFVRDVMGLLAPELFGPGLNELLLDGLRRVQDIAYMHIQDGSNRRVRDPYGGQIRPRQRFENIQINAEGNVEPGDQHVNYLEQEIEEGDDNAENI